MLPARFRWIAKQRDAVHAAGQQARVGKFGEENLPSSRGIRRVLSTATMPFLLVAKLQNSTVPRPEETGSHEPYFSLCASTNRFDIVSIDPVRERISNDVSGLER